MRSLYLRWFAKVYTCAFVSILLQYRGLLSEDGLLPAQKFWQQLERSYKGFWQLPSLLWFCDLSEFDLTVEGIALSGTIVSILAGNGICEHAVLYAFMFLAYLSIFTIGQTFLSFQWDILLLEAGAATILYAPLFKLVSEDKDEGHPALYLLRSIVVKLMILSGVVKVYARCPTWEHLTALEYHFASTCLPTSEAWIFHSFPPVLLRLGVAFMFLTELVAPWLMLFPITAIRRAGVLIQIPLQVLIQFTGNYTFFNLLTLVLLIPAWSKDFSANNLWERSWWKVHILVYLSCFAWLAFTFTQLFPIVWIDTAAINERSFLKDAKVKNYATQEWTENMIQVAISHTKTLYGIVLLNGLIYSVCGRSFKMRCWRFMSSLLCLTYLGLIILPYRSILNQEVPLPYAAKPAVHLLEPWLTPFRVSSSYGLFRRMTGVGHTKEAGWAGVPTASRVAVPAVIVEISLDAGASWLEVPFRYAPYKTDRAPRRTAPHQPRLDWQMWFAALGSYQHNPWFLHLLYRILRYVEERQQDPVIDLLDLDAFIIPTRPSSKNQALVRAWRYEYDFTRAASPWAITIPGSKLSECTPTLWPDAWHLDSSAAIENRTSPCRDYWTRERFSEYVPTVDRSLLLNQVIQPQGWPAQPTAFPFDINEMNLSPFSFASLAFVYYRYLGGHRLRKFVGFSCNHNIFIDGPLLLILLALTLPWCFRRVLRIFSSRLQCYRQRWAYARSKKNDDRQ